MASPLAAPPAHIIPRARDHHARRRSGGLLPQTPPTGVQPPPPAYADASLGALRRRRSSGTTPGAAVLGDGDEDTIARRIDLVQGGGGGVYGHDAVAEREGRGGVAGGGGNVLASSWLAPRMAVVLKVPRMWHSLLFVARLLSVAPAVIWGLQSLLLVLDRALMSVLALRGGYEVLDREGNKMKWGFVEAVAGLASIWCLSAGYLSFFFTDCLMSRWLINYTPQATIVRLLAISAANTYITSTVLFLVGGLADSRLLLPGWITIATTLTICYHITHQQINIRKETSTSINVFSIASFITMASLLALLYHQCPQPTFRCEAFPEPPVVSHGRGLWHRFQYAAAVAAAGGAEDGRIEL